MFVLIVRIGQLMHLRSILLDFDLTRLILVQQLFVEVFQLFFVALVIGHFSAVLLDNPRQHVRLQEQGLIFISDVVLSGFDLFVMADQMTNAIGKMFVVEQMSSVQFFVDQVELFSHVVEMRHFRRNHRGHLIQG